MTDVSGLLESVADELNNSLFPAVSRLLAENTRLTQERDDARAAQAAAEGRSSELEAEDAAESSAAADVKAAADNVAGLFAAPDVPDVDPGLNVPPAEGDDAPADDELPVDGDDSTNGDDASTDPFNAPGTTATD